MSEPPNTSSTLLATTTNVSSNSLVDISQLQNIVQLHKSVLDALPVTISVYKVISRTEFRMALINRASFQDANAVEADVLGKQLKEIMDPTEAARFEQRLQACLDSGVVTQEESLYQLPQGTIWTRAQCVPLRAAKANITHILVIWEDITARKQQESDEREQQEAIIANQAATLAELSTPLLAISDTTVVMPLVGTVDSRRIRQIMEALLSGVAEARASNVILDITGVAVVDTQVANAFLRASQAVRLLGAQVIITGIRPEVAQTLVGLGVDLQGIITRSSLQSGISYALRNE